MEIGLLIMPNCVDPLRMFALPKHRRQPHRRLLIKHGHFPIKHGHFPIKHGHSPFKHAHFPP